MTHQASNNVFPNPSLSATGEAHPARRHRLRWGVILSLAVIALLWPVSGLLGFDGPVRAFTIIGVTLLAWISVAGFARVARPVLSLTLAGAGYGLLYLTANAIMVTPLVFFAWYTVAVTAGVGALAGLAALGIQRLLAR